MISQDDWKGYGIFLDSDASRKLEKSGVAEGEDIFGDTVVKLLVRERGEVWKEKA